MCWETSPHRSGRGRRKRTRTTGTSSAAYFTQRWRASGVLARIYAELHQMVRVHDGLNPRTAAVILDSQSVKGAETVGQTAEGSTAES